MTVSPAQVSVEGDVGAPLEGAFAVSNPTACGIDLALDAVASPTGIEVRCPKRFLRSSESMTCEMAATATTAPGMFKRRYVATAVVANDCKTAAFAVVDERDRRELQPAVEALTRLNAASPRQVDVDERERQLLAKMTTAREVLQREEVALPAELKAELSMLTKLWAEAEVAQKERIQRYRLKLELLQTEDPAGKALEAAIDRTRAKADTDLAKLAKQEAEVCTKVTDLLEQKRVELAELHASAWHDKCKRTASQILREDGEALATHLRRAGGVMVPAPQEVIDERTAKFDALIAAARSDCADVGEKKRITLDERIKEIKELEGKRPLLVKARADAIDQTRKDWAALEQAGQRAVRAQQDRIAATQARYAARLAELQAKRAQLEQDLVSAKTTSAAAFDKAVRKHRDDVRELDATVTRIRNELIALRVKIANAHLETRVGEVLLRATVRRP